MKRNAAVPSSVDLLFMLLAGLIPFVWVRPLLNADGDLARHLRVGETILHNGGLFYRDPFSFTMYGKPFVPYEWLSEVTVALLNRLGGLPAVAIFHGIVIGLTYALVVLFLRRRGVDPLLGLLVGVLAAGVSCVHWLARPHIFTPLGAILLLFILEPADGEAGQGRYQKRRLLWLIPLFALWANLHGGFLYGLVLIGVYLSGDVIESWQSRRTAVPPGGAAAAPGDAAPRRPPTIYHALALGIAASAVLLNPVGPRLYSHVLGWFGQRYLIDNTAEYMSPDFHMRSVQFFLLALVLVVGALGATRLSIRWTRMLLVLANTFFALYSGRNIPLFAVTALPVLTLELDGSWRELPWLGRLREGFARGDLAARTGIWSGALALLLAALAIGGGRVRGAPIVTARFEPDIFPVEAVQRARSADLGGRIYNNFGWGGYILWAWPEQKVFIDGQTDFYGEKIFRTYQEIAALKPGWRRQLDSLDISIVLVGSRSALGNELEREPGWSRWYADSTAMVLRRAEPSTPSE